MPRHVRKGDTVMITSGNFKGQTGQVLRVIPDDDRVVVKGINLRTKHMKPSRINPQGGVISREEPIHISNVSPVVDGKPTRVRFRVLPDGSKVRVAARGGKELGVVRRATSERRGKKA
jgi:large subunit ribosomal protein L24